MHFLTDEIEGVQRLFTANLAGLASEPYYIRLLLPNSGSLKYRRLTQDLDLCYKVHHRLVDAKLQNALPRPVCTTIRGRSF
jgi:hypothetical protein